MIYYIIPAFKFLSHVYLLIIGLLNPQPIAWDTIQRATSYKTPSLVFAARKIPNYTHEHTYRPIASSQTPPSPGVTDAPPPPPPPPPSPRPRLPDHPTALTRLASTLTAPQPIYDLLHTYLGHGTVLCQLVIAYGNPQYTVQHHCTTCTCETRIKRKSHAHAYSMTFNFVTRRKIYGSSYLWSTSSGDLGKQRSSHFLMINGEAKFELKLSFRIRDGQNPHYAAQKNSVEQSLIKTDVLVVGNLWWHTHTMYCAIHLEGDWCFLDLQRKKLLRSKR